MRGGKRIIPLKDRVMEGGRVQKKARGVLKETLGKRLWTEQMK